jgi:hypothetical protein
LERVEQVMDLKETLAASPARRMYLDLENADGAGTRLRLDLRGSTLGATIDVEDPISAELMRSRVNELHRALSRVGLDAESMRIQSARLPVEGMEASLGGRGGSGELLRALVAEGLEQQRNETSGNRNQGESAYGRQAGGKDRDPSQRNKPREEQK